MLKSYFIPVTRATFDSRYNNKIIVREIYGKNSITDDTGDFMQSGTWEEDVWKVALSNLQSPIKSCLMLGVAGGTIVDLLAKSIKLEKIVGVEIDPMMIKAGVEFFDLLKHKELQIINADAYKYVIKTNAKFDITLVDLFIGSKVPNFVNNSRFLKKLSKISTKTIINSSSHTDETRMFSDSLQLKLKKHFASVKIEKTRWNTIFICISRNFSNKT